ncbi:MAG: TonB-dependent receptor plug domain-containing protein [Muribaculaceae bacterium]|nr:TonB-dependent receptor plug domain-containing protein [Muribaculaceae bacterium]MDE6344937.1 TonB-dependent receptor plug domain-containing protein [Muribaculaceae bacterium]MDE6610750.1 TonB-dependent receptor plug domain-containing protein [Muribaculaceae bacterium]
MMKLFMTALLAVVAAFSIVASEPFIGTVRNTKGKPIKGVKVYVENPNDAVKTDRKGEFTFEDADSIDVIFIDYKGKKHSFATNGRSDMMLVVGEDGRMFDKDSYVGETFHGHLIDYNGKPIRGAMVYASDPFDYVKSDRDGKFLIDNVVETDTLHIKHDGYIHDIAMDGSKGMYIKILRNTGRRIDDEEVNIGAGSVRLRDYNGPYSKMTAKQLEATGETDLVRALKWMPGIIVSPSGHISIRNYGSPLWIIDGVPTSPEGLTVMEVERVVVLKDGAVYGTRGAGGVIVVTTKGSNF